MTMPPQRETSQPSKYSCIKGLIQSTNMRITIFAPFRQEKNGISRVAEELIKKMSTFDEVDEVSIITPSADNYVDEAILENQKVSAHPFRVLVSPISFSKLPRLVHPIDFVKLVKLYKNSDVFFALTMPTVALYFVFLLCKLRLLPDSKIFQVLHDFALFVYPSDSQKKLVQMLCIHEKWFLNVPTRYVADSLATKNDAVRFWRLAADKIDVIHLASFVEPRNARTTFGSNKILIVSDIAQRKNHVRLLEAFDLIQQECPYAELVIVGSVIEPVPEFESLIADMQAEHSHRKITRYNHASDQDIVYLYSEADVFVYPSLYEGFGLPVLEAMACGCPVITSNVSSLPEVAGDAAILVDPHDPKAIARAIIAVLKDDELKRELSKRGVEQAKKFSWEKTAQDFLEVFDKWKS